MTKRSSWTLTTEAMEDHFRIGVITRPHGVLGEMKVYPVTDDIKRFKGMKEILMGPPEGQKGDLSTVKVEGVRFQKNMVLLKLSGIESPEEARKLSQYQLYVKREDAIPLSDGEYYVSDLLGLSVLSEKGEKLGILKDVLKTAANDVYVVKGEREILVPAVKEYVLSIDLPKGEMTVLFVEGM
ncbi:MAG: 16S rRNA processing protein RimM [Lachnospiraceae bacterium]|nr:16S rRNA processing protein RimM [Lachnospiraceae bacterium]